MFNPILEGNGLKNPNNSHNYHGEIEPGISKRNTSWHSTPEKRTHNKQTYSLWSGAAGPCTMSHGTYIHIMILMIPNYTIEICIWQARKNNSITSCNKPSWPRKLLVCIDLLERAYFNYLVCSYDTWYFLERMVFFERENKMADHS